MSAPWLLMPFLAGAWLRGHRRGAGGPGRDVAGRPGIRPRDRQPDGGRPPDAEDGCVQPGQPVAVVCGQPDHGPLYGWLGYRWRARRAPAAALLAALPIPALWT
jgi:hypothetical protein